MFAAAVSKPEIAQNAFVATKKCKSMPTAVIQYRTLQKGNSGSYFLAEGALSYHIIVLNHYDLF